MQTMAKWQRLGPGDPPGTSGAAVRWQDGICVPSSPQASITIWIEVLLKKSLLSIRFRLLISLVMLRRPLTCCWVPAMVSGAPTASAWCKGGEADTGEVIGHGSHPDVFLSYC